MKDLHVLRRKKLAAGKKLKLVCRFNGYFQPKQPSNIPRYVGGETRIVSVERSIGFLRLRSVILDLCPKTQSFYLKYQITDSTSSDSSMVSVVSDDDVRCMIRVFDDREAKGSNVRLWIFVSHYHGYVSNDDLNANTCEFMDFNDGFRVLRRNNKFYSSGSLYFNASHDPTMEIKKPMSKNEGLSLRKMVLKQQLLAKQSNRTQTLVSNGNPDRDFVAKATISTPMVCLSNSSMRFVSRVNCHCSINGVNGMICNSFNGMPCMNNTDQSALSYFNRENSRPSNVNFDPAAKPYCNRTMIARSSNGSIRDHRFGVTDITNVKLNGRSVMGKWYPGLKPSQAISKRFHYPNPSQAYYENLYGIPIRCNPQLCCFEKESMMIGSKKGVDADDFASNHGNKSVDLVDFSLKNLSLSSSSSKGVEPPGRSSIASSVVTEESVKSPSKPDDLMDDSLSQKAIAKLGKSHVNETQIASPMGLSTFEKVDNTEPFKCFEVNGGITKELQNIENSDLEDIKEIGSGTYGAVYYGKWKGSDVAIKRIKPSCLKGTIGEDRLVADFWKEAHMLSQLHHPNIVAFYGVVTDGTARNLAAVTEYMVNGSLKQVLRRKDRTIDRRKRVIIARDAAFGMEYLHEKNIVHFDVKSHNFLVNMRDPQRPVCKIGDLGLAKVKENKFVAGGVRGTIPWMAPELLNSENKMVTEKVDVYSFGIVMWELLTCEEPYANMRSEEVLAGIINGDMRPEIPNWCDPAWRSLMERCWSSDPESRPSFSEIAKELRAMAASMNIK